MGEGRRKNMRVLRCECDAIHAATTGFQRFEAIMSKIIAHIKSHQLLK